MPYEPVSHGPIVRATLTELDLLLTEAEYQFSVLFRHGVLTRDLLDACGAVGYALGTIRAEAVTPTS